MSESKPATTTDPSSGETPKKHHVCPWWMGYLLLNPLRRRLENPEKIFAPFVKKGMTIVEVGPGMGYFSLPLAHMVGEDGRVVCVDVQERMLAALRKRASKRGLDGIIETRLCDQEGLGLEDLGARSDLVLLFHVVHETTYQERFVRECAAVLKPGGRLLIAEPSGHVDEAKFDETIRLVRETGLEQQEPPQLRKSRTALFEKPKAAP